ncbi:hypothetical protein R50072_33900 [Simiduia litorea]|uniref:hypothetical protein n=1 Tax=Simiduia litorea TaxID=1435348 RepID=UPI0036F1CB47
MNHVVESDRTKTVEDLLPDLEHLDADALKPFPFLPIFFQVSGLYEWKMKGTVKPVPYPTRRPLPIPNIPSVDVSPLAISTDEPDELEYNLDTEALALPFFPFKREELRLDTDGRFPQNTVSGTLFTLNRERAHWIASLKKIATNRWKGNIWFKDGQAALLPYTNVDVQAKPVLFGTKTVRIKFYGGGAPSLVRTFSFKSLYHHKVEFEYDVVDGTSAVTTIHTHAHPNRPAGLAAENLSIEKVFQRAGFDVSVSPGSAGLPIAGAGPDHLWTDMEMHDAMQTYWSRFADKPQWAMWVLFAARHQTGSNLGGVMFDDIGPNHRQGTAMFNDSFIANAPAGDANPAAWVNRMKFWTAVHEMGHAFNLAHAWQKHIGAPWGSTWMPLTSDSESRSFMNYPFLVAGGQSAFFSDFDYRFIDEELLFMRHAPARFVQMGNEAWFSNHGLHDEDKDELNGNLHLTVRANRPQTRFEFMEPVTLELKLHNVSNEDLILDQALLTDGAHLMVLVKQPNGNIKRWTPFAHHCHKPGVSILHSDKAIYASLPLFAGGEGWLFSEPGRYEVVCMLEHEGLMVLSSRLPVSVMPPKSYDEQVLAQDYFDDDVARALAFGGTNVLTRANDVLHQLVAKFGTLHAATHAAAALVQPQMMSCALLDVDKKDKLVFKKQKADIKSGFQLTKKSLLKNSAVVAETLGHIRYHETLAAIASDLMLQGDRESAEECRTSLESTLTKRKVAAHVMEKVKSDTRKLFSKHT